MTRKTIGLISDTHGLLRPEVAPVFAGVNLIIHAGDIGTSDVLKQLSSIAPVVAVRGNNDKGEWARGIPETEVARVGNVSIHVLHDLKEMAVNPRAAGFDVVVSGHSHRPSIDRREGVLFVNPGSAGPRRFKLPITVARLTIEGTKVDGEVVELCHSIAGSVEGRQNV
jgi:uncharacterized protein